jgi:hypothetical protein
MPRAGPPACRSGGHVRITPTETWPERVVPAENDVDRHAFPRNPVPIVAGSTSKSSTISTLMISSRSFLAAAGSAARLRGFSQTMPGRECQHGVSCRHCADTGCGVEPPSKDKSHDGKADQMSQATIEVNGLCKRFGPMAAGLAIQAATGLRNLPHRPIGGPAYDRRAAELSC